MVSIVNMVVESFKEKDQQLYEVYNTAKSGGNLHNLLDGYSKSNLENMSN